MNATFKVMNANVPLWVFIMIFIVVALFSLGLYLFLVFKKTKRVYSEYGEVDTKELKRIENFEDYRNDFEAEVAKIKKIMRNIKRK